MFRNPLNFLKNIFELTDDSQQTAVAVATGGADCFVDRCRQSRSSIISNKKLSIAAILPSLMPSLSLSAKSSFSLESDEDVIPFR